MCRGCRWALQYNIMPVVTVRKAWRLELDPNSKIAHAWLCLTISFFYIADNIHRAA